VIAFRACRRPSFVAEKVGRQAVGVRLVRRAGFLNHLSGKGGHGLKSRAEVPPAGWENHRPLLINERNQPFGAAGIVLIRPAKGTRLRRCRSEGDECGPGLAGLLLKLRRPAWNGRDVEHDMAAWTFNLSSGKLLVTLEVLLAFRT
jgi:hypothetical protein